MDFPKTFSLMFFGLQYNFPIFQANEPTSRFVDMPFIFHLHRISKVSKCERKKNSNMIFIQYHTTSINEAYILWGVRKQPLPMNFELLFQSSSMAQHKYTPTHTHMHTHTHTHCTHSNKRYELTWHRSKMFQLVVMPTLHINKHSTDLEHILSESGGKKWAKKGRKKLNSIQYRIGVCVLVWHHANASSWITSRKWLDAAQKWYTTITIIIAYDWFAKCQRSFKLYT